MEDAGLMRLSKELFSLKQKSKTKVSEKETNNNDPGYIQPLDEGHQSSSSDDDDSSSAQANKKVTFYSYIIRTFDLYTKHVLLYN